MTDVNELQPFIEQALSLGAVDALVIDPASVVTAAWVPMKCRFGCSGYGKRHGCPPNTPGPDETRKIIDCYQRAILIHITAAEDETAADRVVTPIVFQVERAVFLAGYYKAFGFGAGPCRLCQKCAYPERCIHPSEARPSMEACGIDVYATARANELPIQVVRKPGDRQNGYGLILVD